MDTPDTSNQSPLDTEIAQLHKQLTELQTEGQKLQLIAQLKRQVAAARANVENEEKENP